MFPNGIDKKGGKQVFTEAETFLFNQKTQGFRVKIKQKKKVPVV